MEELVYLDRGEVQLKGLPEPVRLIQVVREADVPEEVAPFSLPEARISPLPLQPTPFIGRQREVEEIKALLGREEVRLLTLTGPGGTGKTRLALQAAERAMGLFSDGVVFVSLASLTDPGLVPFTIAGILKVKERSGQPILETLIEHLRAKRLLLVLDNFEHLLPAAEVVSHLLAVCPELTILVTSRAVLHLAAEHEYPVLPLALPDPRHLPELGALSQYDAVTLFVQRAQTVTPSFAVANENAPAVAEICQRLDGLPLAIELAATRIKLFPPQALLQRLSSRLKLLTGGATDRPTRQQTLRNTLDWSYSLLSEEEQALFARLAVFAGGCSFEAAEAVCNPEGELDLLAGMASLVDRSLIRQEGEEEPRFSMLETIREYAHEKLDERGEGHTIRAAHAGYFLQLAEEAEPELTGPKQGAWLSRLDEELDNLRGALRWFLERGEVEEELRLAAALFCYWRPRGFWSEGGRWLEGRAWSGWWLMLSASWAASPRGRAVSSAQTSGCGKACCWRESRENGILSSGVSGIWPR
jgi:predicted ATPase